VRLVVLACGAAVAALAAAFGQGPGTDRRSDPSVRSAGAASVAEPVWPAPRVALLPLTPPATGLGRALRLYLDAGHGAEGNRGNVSAVCEPEQDFTKRLARELVSRLDAAADFDAMASRTGAELPSYAARVEQARAWRADLFVSLHSDVRGQWLATEGGAMPPCPESAEEPGFAVLWSDEAEGQLLAGRVAFARALGWRLEQIGLPPYDGAGYRDLYERDPEQPGVFLDRHATGKRIYVLRTAEMPAVILETHNAWHPGEVERWNEASTLDAVATAIMAAAADWARSLGLGPEPP
jgi:N-acetylmuramoyl-L-alanine amidase